MMRELWQRVAPALAGAAVAVVLWAAIWCWYIVLSF